MCKSAALSLAIDNLLSELAAVHDSECQSLMRIALELDVDFETLQRQRRRRRNGAPARTSGSAKP
jgi:hypothetical protein